MLKLYNSLTRKIEEFEPINPPKVGIYTCGPTVYRDIHIGNFRTYLMSDFLRRILEYQRYRVTHIKNITDVGHMRLSADHHHGSKGSLQVAQIDPVIEEALAQGKSPQEITAYYTELFLKDEEKLNIEKATQYPKASEHVSEMIAIIKILLEKGLAYNKNGTIYFDVKKFESYGKLSGNTLNRKEKLLKAVRVSLETDKKDSADFALWKKAEKDRLMKWDSPWGAGFPGWHIECSAMSMKYLGDTFDIHTGGEDLIFPHHEDEIAQSEGASGKKFVNYWVHGGYLLVDGEKMSRSKGNVYTISDLEKKGFDPLSFRYLAMMTHYRAKMNFTFEALKGAQTALDRLKEETVNWDKPEIGCAEYEERFLTAINNDLSMPEALSIVWELLKSDYPSSAKAESLFKFDEVLGLGLSNYKEEKRKKDEIIPKDIMKMVEEREELRRSKHFTQADHLRNRIKKLGYVIQDRKGKASIIKKI